MDRIRYKCARCGEKLESAFDLEGQTDRCPKCGQANRVPKKRSLLGSLFGRSQAPPPKAQSNPRPSRRAKAEAPMPVARKAPAAGPSATRQIHAAGQDDPESNFGRFHTFCKNCNDVIYVSRTLKGKKTDCPRCGQRIKAEAIHWTGKDEEKFQVLLARFTECSYGGGNRDAKQMQQLRDMIQKLSRKKAHSGKSSVGMDVEFDTQ